MKAQFNELLRIKRSIDRIDGIMVHHKDMIQDEAMLRAAKAELVREFEALSQRLAQEVAA